MTKTATIRVPALKVTVAQAADALPGGLVPKDGPAGEPLDPRPHHGAAPGGRTLA